MRRTLFLGASLSFCALLAWSGCAVKKKTSGGTEAGTGGAAVDGSSAAGTDDSATSGDPANGSGGNETTTAPTTTGGMASPGLCCSESDGPGCGDDAAIEQCVCDQDPYCCETAWDATCISEVNEFACGECDVPDPGPGGDPGGEPVGCVDDGTCSLDDDCVCSDCDADDFCSDPANCVDDGMCNAYTEGCVCADCSEHEQCTD